MGSLENKTCKRGHDWIESNLYFSRGHSTCKICRLESNKRWKATNSDENKLQEKITRVKSRYGISSDMYQSMLTEQKFKCAICKGDMGIPRIDHDHKCCPGSKSCGRCVRGLLCDNCNKGLGQFKDNEKSLKNALLYVRKHAKFKGRTRARP